MVTSQSRVGKTCLTNADKLSTKVRRAIIKVRVFKVKTIYIIAQISLAEVSIMKGSRVTADW